MKEPELIVILLNLVIVLIAYFMIYLKLAGADGNKLAISDIFTSGISIIIAGTLFWNSGQEFNALFFKLNWFWFTLFTYAAIEIPLMLWYYKRNNVWESFSS
ncbi:hypothetical protein ACJJIG_04090 [Microbulbifer sp. SSSA007]|uniref:hypothetical protein n=1 Tax=Microbulbifer sp. SSSA007 TaxID=3243379 RepID=UPI00403A0195